MTHWKETDAKLNSIREDLTYLRGKIDKLEDRLNGLMWKVMGLGAGAGAVGYVVAIVLSRTV